MSAEDSDSKISAFLNGAMLKSVGRALNMGVLEFHAVDGSDVSLHVQCPFRFVQGGSLVLGSADIKFTAESGANERKVYDSRADILNGILSRLDVPVTNVELEAAGYLRLSWRERLFFEVFPDCSGAVEAWRVLQRGGEHYGFPASLI